MATMTGNTQAPDSSQAHPAPPSAPYAERLLAESLRLHWILPYSSSAGSRPSCSTSTTESSRSSHLQAGISPRARKSPISSPGTPQLMKAPEERLMFLPLQLFQAQAHRPSEEDQARGFDQGNRSVGSPVGNRRFEHFREYLVRTNLALVLPWPSGRVWGDVDFGEIVSEGQHGPDARGLISSMLTRASSFSTYACRAISQGLFVRTAMKAQPSSNPFPVEFEPEMEKSDWSDRKRDLVEEDCVDELKQIVDRNLAELSDVEQTVIRRRFNWKQAQGSPADAGRGRQDHRRHQGAGPPDPEQGLAQDQERDGGRCAAHPASSGRR